MKKSVDDYWYSTSLFTLLLLPLSWLFCFVSWLRKLTFQAGLLRKQRLPVPVVVVGNITVGGTGKTPLVTWIVEYLLNLGYRPGVVSRGYSGKGDVWPSIVSPESDPKEVGDEPVLIAKRTDCPVCVGPDRPSAGRKLIETGLCDIIVSDDGLQHYALERDLEIAVLDGDRRLGNGHCLPAGPLREKPSRLASVDIVVCNGGSAQPGEFQMYLVTGDLINLKDESMRCSPADFIGGPVHAVAGIGNPKRFFQTLQRKGLEVIEHPFPDHHLYTLADIDFHDEFPVLMTEKDAVKCLRFARVSHWYLRTEAELGSDFSNRLDSLMRELKNG